MQVLSGDPLGCQVLKVAFLHSLFDQLDDVAVLTLFPKNIDTERIAKIFIIIIYLKLHCMGVYYEQIDICVWFQFWELEQVSPCHIEA